MAARTRRSAVNLARSLGLSSTFANQFLPATPKASVIGHSTMLRCSTAWIVCTVWSAACTNHGVVRLHDASWRVCPRRGPRPQGCSRPRAARPAPAKSLSDFTLRAGNGPGLPAGWKPTADQRAGAADRPRARCSIVASNTHLVIRSQGCRQLPQRRWRRLDSFVADLPAPVQHRHLRELLWTSSPIVRNGTPSNGLRRKPDGQHDTYGSALVAQPGCCRGGQIHSRTRSPSLEQPALALVFP